jgi:hypothetical protein
MPLLTELGNGFVLGATEMPRLRRFGQVGGKKADRAGAVSTKLEIGWSIFL